MQTYMPGYGPGVLFMDAGILQKLVMLLTLLLFLPILVIGVIGLVNGKGALGLPLVLLAGASGLLGLLGFLYTVMTIQQVLSRIGPVSFSVTAPSYAEGALVAALGLFGAALAMGLRLFGDRRR